MRARIGESVAPSAGAADGFKLGAGIVVRMAAMSHAESGGRLGGAVLADFTATARVHPRFDLQAGVRNALDRRYEDPVCLTVDRLRGDGRSVFVRLVWRAWE